MYVYMSSKFSFDLGTDNGHMTRSDSQASLLNDLWMFPSFWSGRVQFWHGGTELQRTSSHNARSIRELSQWLVLVTEFQERWNSLGNDRILYGKQSGEPQRFRGLTTHDLCFFFVFSGGGGAPRDANITLHHIALRCSTLHCVTSHRVAWHCLAFHCMTLH